MRAANLSRKAGGPSGRPIVSAPRSAAIAASEAGASIKSLKRKLHRSRSGATLASPSWRDAICARVFDQRQSHARAASRARTGVRREVAGRRHQALLVHDRRSKARLKRMPGHPHARVDHRALTRFERRRAHAHGRAARRGRPRPNRGSSVRPTGGRSRRRRAPGRSRTRPPQSPTARTSTLTTKPFRPGIALTRTGARGRIWSAPETKSFGRRAPRPSSPTARPPRLTKARAPRKALLLTVSALARMGWTAMSESGRRASEDEGGGNGDGDQLEHETLLHGLNGYEKAVTLDHSAATHRDSSRPRASFSRPRVAPGEGGDAVQEGGRSVGRPIVSAPRNRPWPSSEAGPSIRSPKRNLHRSRSGATVARPSSRAASASPTQAPRAAPAPDSARHSGAPSGALVHDRRSEARLKQMPGHPHPRVDHRAVSADASRRAPCRAPPPGRGRGSGERVGRQAVGPDRDAMLAALQGEEIAIELMIRIREKHGLAPISAAHVTWWGRPGARPGVGQRWFAGRTSISFRTPTMPGTRWASASAHDFS